MVIVEVERLIKAIEDFCKQEMKVEIIVQDAITIDKN